MFRSLQSSTMVILITIIASLTVGAHQNRSESLANSNNLFDRFEIAEAQAFSGKTYNLFGAYRSINLFPIEGEIDFADDLNVTGKWNLTVTAQGQTIPVTLELTQKEMNVNGSFTSHIGNGTITDGKVSGDQLTAIANLVAQNQEVTLKLKSKIKDDEMDGTLTADGLPPLPFTGTKVKKKEKDDDEKNEGGRRGRGRRGTK